MLALLLIALAAAGDRPAWLEAKSCLARAPAHEFRGVGLSDTRTDGERRRAVAESRARAELRSEMETLVARIHQKIPLTGDEGPAIGRAIEQVATAGRVVDHFLAEPMEHALVAVGLDELRAAILSTDGVPQEKRRAFAAALQDEFDALAAMTPCAP